MLYTLICLFTLQYLRALANSQSPSTKGHQIMYSTELRPPSPPSKFFHILLGKLMQQPGDKSKRTYKSTSMSNGRQMSFLNITYI